MEAQKRVVIAGGGLGGLAAAAALRKKSRDAIVLERAADLASIQVGVGMVVWPNGMAALDRLGLREEVESVGSRIDHLDFRTPKGKRLRQWRVERVTEKVGTYTVGLSRADLHRVIAGAVDSETLSMGSEYADVDEDDSGVTVKTVEGREVRGSVLVGADGAFSRVRAQRLRQKGLAFPPYSGYTLWHSIIPFDHDAVPAGVFVLIFGRGSRFGYFRIDDDRVYWSAIAYVAEGGKDGERSEVRDLFEDYAAPVDALIENTVDADIHRTDIFGGQPLQAWGHGRVTLLGDAAHPMTTNLGQGAGMALEDAVVLGSVLGEGLSDEAALRTYESRRIQRVEEMMALANRLNSTAALETLFRTWRRNQLLKYAFRRGIGDKYEGLMSAEALE